MYGQHDDAGKRRVVAAIATLAIHGAIAAVLIWGLAGDDVSRGQPDSPLVEVNLTVPPPPPPHNQAPNRAKKLPAPDGAKGKPLPREAPEVAVPLTIAPAAPVAGDGRDPAAGAGAQGSGSGAGGTGTGDGGDGGGVASPAQRIAGALRDSDYPRDARGAGMAGTVAIAFRVRTDGHADRCSIVRSSGYAVLDHLTCRLFTARYRFRPATNAAGEEIESTLQTSFTWGTRRRR